MSEVSILCEYKELKNTQDLKPHPKNRNKHPEDQIDRLAAIIKYQGFRHPIIVSHLSGLIVAGHGRLEAAKKLGLEKVPVDYQEFKSEEQEYAFLQSDNAIALWAELDLAGINADIADLGPDFDLDNLGIKDFVLEPITKYDEETEDEVPEVKKDPGTVLGDIWKLGEHRLMCGDATNIEHVDKLMDGKKADMVFTDIPYNISQKSNGLRELDYGEWDKNVHDIGIKTLFITDYAESFYYFCDDEQLSDLLLAFKDYKFSTRTFVWHKPNPTVMNGDKLWLPSQELCAYAKKPNAIFNEHCAHGFYEGSSNAKRVHPNQKPIELVIKCIKASSNNSVIDLFGGSGSTLIACEKTNRKCFMMELDPQYVRVIIDRWEKYTGQKAELLNG